MQSRNLVDAQKVTSPFTSQAQQHESAKLTNINPINNQQVERKTTPCEQLTFQTSLNRYGLKTNRQFEQQRAPSNIITRLQYI